MSAAIDRNRLIARLHVAKRDLGLDEDLYRQKLEVVTGKRSASDLSDAELQMAVRDFTGRVSASASYQRLPATPQARMIQAQWISLWNLGLVEDNSDAAILAFIKRQTKLDAASWLKRQQDVEAVAEALKHWLERDGGVVWKHDRATPATLRLAAHKVCVAQWRKLEKLGVVGRGVPVPGSRQQLSERFVAYACDVNRGQGPMAEWTNPQWAKVSKALGVKLRAALKANKETAA